MKYGLIVAVSVSLVLGNVASSFAGEVQKQVSAVSVGTNVKAPVLSDTQRPKPGGPGGSEALTKTTEIDIKVGQRERPKPKGPRGSEEFIININTIQH
ncbi:MAG: hypothetical protein IGS39_01105 [Calothrix sp. C42_A2020_038]|nr:hypothetical protein [Calothrix sp. C42_A2020_038]